jgi:hypothetical protein
MTPSTSLVAAVRAPDRRVLGSAEPHSIPGNRFQDRLRIGVSLSNNPEKLVCGDLLLACFRKLFLQLFRCGLAVVLCARHRDFGRHGPYPIP